MFSQQLGGLAAGGGGAMGAVQGGLSTPSPASATPPPLPVSQAPGKDAIMQDFGSAVTTIQALVTKYPIVSTQLNQVMQMLTETMVALGDKATEASTAIAGQSGDPGSSYGAIPQGQQGGKIPLA